MLVKDGRIAYQKAFGSFNYDHSEPVTIQSVYDMASVTKICATTLAIMKLYEQGKINLFKKLGDYLPMVKGTDKEELLIRDVLLHQAGLVPFIPFYKETIDSTGAPLATLYRPCPSDSFPVSVTGNLYLRSDWTDTMFKRILQSPLGPAGRYLYSDNDFIFLAKIVEAVSGESLDAYVTKNFYRPLGLTSTFFKPMEHIKRESIAPTESEPVFRQQLLRGYVHDPGAAMFGGVAGHAGLFSDAYGMAVLMQLLLNGGEFNGHRYLQAKTISLFTAYQSAGSRRGLGFDKPGKDNYKRTDPYPAASASPAAFGHSGFTGTCVWADPACNLVYVFLSNRVTPDATNNKLVKMNVRTNILEAFYKALCR